MRISAAGPTTLFVLLLMTLIGCGPRTTIAPIPSPDGSLRLVTSIEQSRADPTSYLCVVFEIQDATGKVLHKENTGASNVHRWSMYWESDDEIRLDSSDIGPRSWRRQSDGSWRKD